MITRELIEVGKAKDAYKAVREQVAVPIATAHAHLVSVCISAIDAAETLEEVIKSYRMAPNFTEAKARGLERWVDLCETPAQLDKARRTGRHKDFLYRFFWDEELNEAVHPAARKWMRIMLSRIETATTLNEINSLIRNESHGFQGTQQFIAAVARKRASLVETEEDAELVLHHIRNSFYEVQSATKRALADRFVEMGKDRPYCLQYMRGFG